jgi:plasmid replication initiation protein
MNTDEKSLAVRQSNTLIEASYKIASVGEGRLIRMLIAQIQPGDEDFKTYRIAVTDFAKFFGLSGKDVYGLIKKSADELAGRRIMIEEGKSWTRMNWLSSAKYVSGSGYVELCFDKNLKPYLLQLKGYYTQYELDRVVTFRSVYSIRLFEILKSEQFKAKADGYFKISFEYDELRVRLGIEESEYQYFKDFRVRVVDVAVKEINASPDLNIIQVDYPKTGRKITHIVFHCEKAKQTQLDLEGPPPHFEEVKEEHPEDVRELVTLGIDQATAYKWRKKYGVKQVVRNIAYTQAMKRAGKIRDSVTGFLARAVADNLGGGWEEEEKKKAEARARHERAEQDKREREEQEQQEQARRRAETRDAFAKLDEVDKQAVRLAYEAQATPIALRTWKSAKTKSPKAPEEDARVIATFLAFWKDYKAKA